MKKLTVSLLALLLTLTACTRPTAQVTPTPEPAETPADTWSPVYADWSKLTPYETKKPVYTRRYAGYTDRLIPADDYGLLLPYAGQAVTATAEWSYYHGIYDTYYRYGLVTLTGEVVTDPVFADVSELVLRDGAGVPLADTGAMVLTKVFVGEEGEPKALSAIAARDGSWCTDFLYEYDWEMGLGLDKTGQVLPLRKAGEKIALLDLTTGAELREVDFSSFLPPDLDPETDWWNVSGFEFDRAEGWCTLNLSVSQQIEGQSVYTDTPLLFDPHGNRVPLDSNVHQVGAFSEGLAPAQDYFDLWGYINTAGAWVIRPAYSYAGPFSEGHAQVTSGERTSFFIGLHGDPLTQPVDCDYVQQHGDYWYFMGSEWDTALVYDRNLQRVDSPLSGQFTPVAFREEGWASCLSGNGSQIILARGLEAHRFPADLGEIQDLHGDRVLFSKNEEKGWTTTLTDLNGRTLGRWEDWNWAYFIQDDLTGEWTVRGVTFVGEDYARSATDYYDLDGNPIYLDLTDREPVAGLLRRQTEDAFELLTPEGETVFYWPIPQLED